MMPNHLPQLQFGDLEIVYVVFDILYVGSGSVINRTLTERHELLRQTLGHQQTTAIPIGALPRLHRRMASRDVGFVRSER